jgi:predicted RNase H-like nuclease (RuvC/YqgF family)
LIKQKGTIGFCILQRLKKKQEEKKEEMSWRRKKKKKDCILKINKELI